MWDVDTYLYPATMLINAIYLKFIFFAHIGFAPCYGVGPCAARPRELAFFPQPRAFGGDAVNFGGQLKVRFSFLFPLAVSFLFFSLRFQSNPLILFPLFFEAWPENKGVAAACGGQTLVLRVSQSWAARACLLAGGAFSATTDNVQAPCVGNLFFRYVVRIFRLNPR